jgi:glycosyltransferase involved in cell wall biosynthesis
VPLQPLGFLSPQELSSWLQRAAIYLSPARYDPFGLLPLQAALDGCALLLSDIPSYRELWDGAACFFRSDDAQDLRRKWRRLVKDADLRADLWRRAARRAHSNYTPSRMADQYVQVYARVQQAAAA